MFENKGMIALLFVFYRFHFFSSYVFIWINSLNLYSYLHSYRVLTSLLYTSDSIEKALSKLDRDKDKLIELFNNDVITLAEMKTRASALNAEIAEWQRRKESSSSVFNLDKLHTQIASLFGDIRSVLLNNSFDNKLLKQLIEEIVVDEKGQIEIKFQALKELPPFSLSLYEPTE